MEIGSVLWKKLLELFSAFKSISYDNNINGNFI